MSRPLVSSSSRPPASPPRWNITKTNSSSTKSFHILHRPTTASSSASPPLSRPQTAAARLQRPSTAKSPFLSYDAAAAPLSTATATTMSTPVPFSLLDSINAHQTSKGRTTSSNSSRPASAHGRRERHVPEYDLLMLDDEADRASAAVESTQQPQQWKVRERERQERENEMVKYEERKEQADDSRTHTTHTTAFPASTSAAASIAAVAMSSASRVPSSVAALATYTPQSFEHSPTLQHSIQLLHAAPLLASFLPQLATLDTTWSTLLASHSLYRHTESRHMAALRDEELRIRDAMLTFMRVSMEYRRTDIHDAADGRIVRQNDSSAEDTDQAADDGWLVRDDGQRTTIDVDWNGRYWQSERRREKEAWYRAEERELQSMYEHGVQLITQLYRHKFELLMRLAVDQRSSTRVDTQTQQLNTRLHETLTALRLQSTTTTPSSPSPSASASAFLPPRHPSLAAYAGRLYASLHELSTLLTSHYQQVVQVVEHSHTLTSAATSIDQLVRSLHEEERAQREELEQFKQQQRADKQQHKQRETEWEQKLQHERLAVCEERERRLRVESEMAELHDTLARIRVKYEADVRRRSDVLEKGVQYEAMEVAVEEKSSESETKEVEEEEVRISTARKLQLLRAKTRSSTGSIGGSRQSGKQNGPLSLTTPQSSTAGNERLSPRSASSPRSGSSASPLVSPSQGRSPRAGGSSVFTFASPGSGGSTSAPMSAIRSTTDGSGKVMRPALRGGAIADGTARHSKAAASLGGAGSVEQMQSSIDGKGTAVGANKLRWDGVPFV